MTIAEIILLGRGQENTVSVLGRHIRSKWRLKKPAVHTSLGVDCTGSWRRPAPHNP